MFNNKKYITKGISESLPKELITSMFMLIDKLKKKGKKLDYLQVFEIETKINCDVVSYMVNHYQEEPPYNEIVQIIIDEDNLPIISDKVYVIDNSSDDYVGNTTMLFAYEY